MESALTALHQDTANPNPVQPVAVLAALEGHDKILKLCLDKGALIDRQLARAIGKGKGRKSPEMAEVIAPYKAQITEKTRGRKGPDGNFTDEQLEEWYGDIEW